MSFKINSLYLTDGYKVGHKAMLAPGTTKLYGTWIPRSTKHAAKGSWFEVENGTCGYNDPKEMCCDNHDNGCSGYCTEKKSYNIYKDPITDDGTKKSLKGLLQVCYDGSMETYKALGCPPDGSPKPIIVKTECTPGEENTGLLQVIYENGKFYNQVTLEEIRERLRRI